MGSEWVETTLGEVIELKRGYDLPQKERLLGTVPLVSSSGVSDSHAKAMVKGPGVVTGRYGTIGQVFYIEEDFWPLNTTLYVRDFKGNDPRFISYFLRNIDFLAYSDKAAVPGVNRNDLHKAEIRFPMNVEEQRAIAHILGTLDDKIELNRRINQTLEAMAQAIFKSWFVDFDPVKAKIAAIEQGQDPQRAAMRAISGKTDAELDQLPRDQYNQLATTAALFPEAMEDSELGEIPAGWVAGAIGDLAELTIGGDWGKDDPIDEQYVQAVCLRGVDLEHLRATGECPKAPVRWVKKSSIEKRSIESVDLLIGGSGAGPCGRPLYASPLLLDLVGYPVIYSNFVKRFRCKTSSQALYLDRVLWGMFTGGEISNYINGTSVPNLKDKGLFLHSIVIPNFDVLMEFENISQGWLGKLYSKESAGLVELRDTLLPKLISGELRVTQQVLP